MGNILGDFKLQKLRAVRLGLRHLPRHILISTILLAGCVAIRIADPEPVARLRSSFFDTYLRRARFDPSFPVRIVAIDEASLAQVGQWPWPRTKLADSSRVLIQQVRSR
jgi:adenylate cyclase